VLAAQLRALDQQARRRRQAEVGRLADEVGLLAYDLEVLRRVFADVAATLTQG
jgi:hypothetical protein